MKYQHPALPEHSSALLSEGEHEGIQWAVLHNGRGCRCGYIALPPGHPWHGFGYDEIDAAIHGGLTYAQGSADGSHWIGFDCSHYGDAADPTLPNYREDFFRQGVIRTREYVEEQCLSLCEQAAKAVKVKDPSEPTPADRAARIRPLLKLYQDQTGTEDEHLVSDFLADLAHYCDEEDVVLHQAIDRAEGHYLEEILANAKPNFFTHPY